jgi:hypothetical protein
MAARREKSSISLMSSAGKGGSSCVFSTIGKYAYDNQLSIEVKRSRSGQVVRVVMTHLVA